MSLPKHTKLKLFISVELSGADFCCDIMDCVVDFHFGDYCFLTQLRRLVIVDYMCHLFFKKKKDLELFSLHLCCA